MFDTIMITEHKKHKINFILYQYVQKYNVF